jgi:hypothetical protein
MEGLDEVTRLTHKNRRFRVIFHWVRWFATLCYAVSAGIATYALVTADPARLTADRRAYMVGGLGVLMTGLLVLVWIVRENEEVGVSGSVLLTALSCITAGVYIPYAA